MKNNIEVRVKTGDKVDAKVTSKHSLTKTAVTFHIDPDIKEQLEFLSVLTKQTQTYLVEKALTSMIKTSDVKMPKSCAVFFRD